MAKPAPQPQALPEMRAHYFEGRLFWNGNPTSPESLQRLWNHYDWELSQMRFPLKEPLDRMNSIYGALQSYERERAA